MSLPPLPQTFGNYSLGDFHEVVSPAPVDWLPQTPGWYLLALVLLAWLARRGWRWLRHWHRNRYRREAQRRLASLAASDNGVAAINKQLKLAAMAGFGRPAVASLSGAPWPAFLNRQCTEPPFDGTLAGLLAEAGYRAQPLTDTQQAALLAAAQAWLAEHRNRHGD